MCNFLHPEKRMCNINEVRERVWMSPGLDASASLSARLRSLVHKATNSYNGSLFFAPKLWEPSPGQSWTVVILAHPPFVAHGNCIGFLYSARPGYRPHLPLSP